MEALYGRLILVWGSTAVFTHGPERERRIRDLQFRSQTLNLTIARYYQ